MEVGETEAEHVVSPRDRPPSPVVETGSEQGSNSPKVSWLGRARMGEDEVQSTEWGQDTSVSPG